MGGLVTLRLASLFGTRLAGAVVIDSPVRNRDLTPEEMAARERRAFGPLRVYPSREDAIAHSATIPPQETLPYATAHVAATSVRPPPPPQAARLAPLPQAARLAPLPQAARLAPLPQAARLAPLRRRPG